jgi:hypothetical protein
MLLPGKETSKDNTPFNEGQGLFVKFSWSGRRKILAILLKGT